MKANVRKLYVDKSKNFLYTLVKQIEYMKDLSDDTIEDICYSMKKEYVEPGQDVFWTNDPASNIYFIFNGSINIFINLNMQDVLLETLYKGCTIGGQGVLGKYKT